MRVCLVTVAALLSASACGPDVSGWVGAWKGSATINTGRLPTVLTGTLTVSGDGRFVGTSDPQGTPAQSFSCGLTAATATAGKATFAPQATCDATATPADGCTWRLTFETAEATRTGDALKGTGSGRLDSACPGKGNAVENFSMELSATRR